jgi:quinoprotein glucose dehydrogenase
VERESVLSRFTVTGDADPVVDRASEVIVMRIDQPWGNHNGGTIVFGPDAMLYVALGDGGARADRGGNGQNLGTLLGSVLRIDVRHASEEEPYLVPDDNPFVGAEGARGEIWAYGLRNPWRISFDRANGDLWCGDVGQDVWEEVDRLVRGGNYGWPLEEGLHVFPPDRADTSDDPENLIPPVAEYRHTAGISVTGGYVYRGESMPWLVGRYVYGDFAFRTVWAVREDRDGGEHDVIRIGTAPSALASFAETPDGEHLALCFDGRIYRMIQD